MTTFLNPLEKLAHYNHWANEQLLTHVENLPERVPASSLKLLSHIFVSQAIWLSRIQNSIYSGLPSDEISLAECRQIYATTSPELMALASLPPDELTKIIAYKNTQGAAFENALVDILTHVFNHGTYHRAQIARDLRQNNLIPINTDYITYVRQLPATPQD